jgi:sterol desaturase/sphingolipid hydroxylase (fatty acid hydroxylase superfamily)
VSFLDSPYDYLQAHKIVIFAVLIALTTAGLAWDMLRAQPRDPKETISNLVIFAGNSSMNLFVAQALQLAALGWVASLAPWRVPVNLYSFAACLIALDLCYYWRHRWEHEIHLLWAEHSVHHSSEEFNFSTSIRLPLVNPLLGWIFFTPLAIAGFPPKLILASFFLNLLYQYWVHNGQIGRLGWLEHVLSTPSNHRVHHARNPGYLDKNYGGILILWDKLFGTYAPETVNPEFGIVEPIATQNPLLVNLRPITRLYGKARKQPTFGRKLRVLFGPPGLEL